MYGRGPARSNTHLRDARRRLQSPSGSGRPMSRQELADAINAVLFKRHAQQSGLDENYIGKLERGKYRWPNDRYREAFRAVLGARSDAEIGFFIIRDLHRGGAARAAEPSVWPDPVMGPELNRRVLLASAAAAMTAAGLGDVSPSNTQRIGNSDIQRLLDVAEIYRSIDYECGGGLLAVEVARLADSATALLTRPQHGELRTQLATAVASVRQLAGWTAFDAGMYADSQRHFMMAERLAADGDDPRLIVKILYCQARQLQHLHHNLDAVHTLQYAKSQLGTGGTPAMNAMVLGSAAASMAAWGDRRAVNTLAMADDMFGRIEPDHEPDWMRFYDLGELMAQHGRVYRDLARQDPKHADLAVETVTTAISSFGPGNVRSTVLNKVGLCSALFLADEPDKAMSVGVNVIEHARHLTSRRVLERVRNIERDIGRHARRSDVRHFSHDLTSVGGSA